MKTMKKIVLTFIAAMLCVMATAQMPQQVEDLKVELDRYRQHINEKVYSLVAITDADDREDVVDGIEDLFDDIEDYVEKRINKIVANSSVSKTVAYGDFFCIKTPTTINIKYGNFIFNSTPVTYEYHDGDIEVRTTPTTQSVKTPAFQYESTPTRSSFRIFGEVTAGDTIRVREGENVSFSVAVNDPNSNFKYDTTYHKYVYVRQRNNGTVSIFRDTLSARSMRALTGKRHHDFSIDSDDNTYFYIGVNNFLNEDDEIDEPKVPFMELNSGRSLELGFYTTIHRWKLSRFLAMDMGFDYRLRHYSFEQSFTLVKNDGVLAADYTLPEGVTQFKKHNLRLQYISLPLTMEWRLGEYDNPFILSAGIEGSLRIGSREKQVYKLDDERKVNRNRNDFETALLRYACTFGVGYRRFELYCNYSPMELFKHNRGPELYPISIGVRFLVDND